MKKKHTIIVTCIVVGCLIALWNFTPMTSELFLALLAPWIATLIISSKFMNRHFLGTRRWMRRQNRTIILIYLCMIASILLFWRDSMHIMYSETFLPVWLGMFGFHIILMVGATYEWHNAPSTGRLWMILGAIGLLTITILSYAFAHVDLANVILALAVMLSNWGVFAITFHIRIRNSYAAHRGR